MNKLLIILCIGFMMPATGISQRDTTFRVVRTLKGDIVDFTVDNLDNVYILNSRNQVKKYNANGDSVAIYNDIRKYGRATLIDVSNPLKVCAVLQGLCHRCHVGSFFERGKYCGSP